MQPARLTDDWNKSMRARAVPDAWWDPGAGAWCLPPTADAHSCRIALRLFPQLITNTELVARAAVQDIRPIDLATPRWRQLYPTGRAYSMDPWKRVAANAFNERGYTPHPYQRIDADYAIERLNVAGGFYFGWEPGLGKTLGACMVMDAWDVNFALIACPNGIKLDPWMKDLPVYCPWMEPVIIGNTAATRRSSFDYARARMDAGEPTAVICHYEALALVGKLDRKDGTTWRKLGRFDLKVADEAHRLKNEKTAVVRAFKKIDGVGTLLMSGSCTDGEFEDLFVPKQLMQPRRYTKRWEGGWNDKYGDYVEGDHGQLNLGVKPHRLEELRAEIGEDLVVRRAADELNIPDPHVHTIDCPLNPDQRKVYDGLVDDLFAQLPSGDYVVATTGASLVNALRQVTAGVEKKGGGVSCSKLERLCERYADIGKQQRVVFCWHKAAAERAAAALCAMGLEAVYVHGGITGARREERVAAFMERRAQVIVATMGTLGVGVNLQQAGGVSFLEKSYRPLDNEQARDRVVRQGQLTHALVEYYQSPDTVDTLQVEPVLTSKTLLRQLLVGR